MNYDFPNVEKKILFDASGKQIKVGDTVEIGFRDTEPSKHKVYENGNKLMIDMPNPNNNIRKIYGLEPLDKYNGIISVELWGYSQEQREIVT